MTNQQSLFKGERLEEDLRSYFIESGYYVLRGVNLDFKDHSITDIDLFLYSKVGATVRNRLNVDIKNKARPQGFERILWANGLTKILRLDGTIVATTDKRPVLKEFGRLHDTTVIDGDFLRSLRDRPFAEGAAANRLVEEDLLSRFRQIRTYDPSGPKNWEAIYKESKSRLIGSYDFASLNNGVFDLGLFLQLIITDQKNRDTAVRMVYLVMSHTLIIADYILKEFAFESSTEKVRLISDGINFGDLGPLGAEKIFRFAEIATQTRLTTDMRNRMLDPRATHLIEFFQKNETARNLFKWAKDFEALGFAIKLPLPHEIDPVLRGVIAVFLDYFELQRKSII